MATKRDYYQVLGLDRKAGPDDVKKAYRRLAKKWHPDHNKSPEAAERFREVNAAYEVLSDAEKRAAYDRFGRRAFEPGGGPGPFDPGGPGFEYHTYGAGPQTEAFQFGGFSDPFKIFEQFFGRDVGVGRRGARPSYEIAVDFMEALKGTEVDVPLNGQRRRVRIPAGVEDGARLRIGDADLLIKIRPHERFTRQGDDLYVTLTIPFTQAALGGVLTVPTPDGDLQVKVHPGTQPGTLVRLRGKGAPRISEGGHGDLYVRLQVSVPTKLSKRQKELLEAFDQEN